MFALSHSVLRRAVIIILFKHKSSPFTTGIPMAPPFKGPILAYLIANPIFSFSQWGLYWAYIYIYIYICNAHNTHIYTYIYMHTCGARDWVQGLLQGWSVLYHGATPLSYVYFNITNSFFYTSFLYFFWYLIFLIFPL
jgi:hypothetical protein